jgi:mannosyltransferase
VSSTSSVGRHIVQRLGAEALEGPAAQPRTTWTGPPWLWLVPSVVTFFLMMWGIGTPSYSRDEAATLSAVRRPLGSLFDMLGHIDAVHGAYYVVLLPFVRLFDAGEMVTRMPSAVGMAVAAAAVFGLGQRLVSTRVGLAASLVFALVPAISYYGQTARPYGLAAGLAAIASYLLVRAMHAAESGQRVRGWMIAYGVSIGVLGYIHLFGLLVLAAHIFPAVRTWWRNRRTKRGGRLSVGWRFAVGWLIAGFLGLASVEPIIQFGSEQRGVSMDWAKAPWLSSVGGLSSLVGPLPMAVVAGAAILCSIAVCAVLGRPRLRAAWPADLVVLCVPWVVMPPAILIIASTFTPLYVFRYVVFCIPAAALLVGAGLAALGWLAGTAVLAVLAVLAAPTLASVRTPTGHGDSIRQADQIIARYRHPNDVLMYFEVSENIPAAYPYGMGQLKNVELGQSAIASDSLGGVFNYNSASVGSQVARAHNVWYVELVGMNTGTAAPPENKLLIRHDFRATRTWHLVGMWLILYERR